MQYTQLLEQQSGKQKQWVLESEGIKKKNRVMSELLKKCLIQMNYNKQDENESIIYLTPKNEDKQRIIENNDLHWMIKIFEEREKAVQEFAEARRNLMKIDDSQSSKKMESSSSEREQMKITLFSRSESNFRLNKNSKGGYQLKPENNFNNLLREDKYQKATELISLSMREEKQRFEMEENEINKYHSIRIDSRSLKLMVFDMINILLFSAKRIYHELILIGSRRDSAAELLQLTSDFKEKTNKIVSQQPLRLPDLLVDICIFSRSRFSSELKKLSQELKNAVAAESEKIHKSEYNGRRITPPSYTQREEEERYSLDRNEKQNDDFRSSRQLFSRLNESRKSIRRIIKAKSVTNGFKMSSYYQGVSPLIENSLEQDQTMTQLTNIHHYQKSIPNEIAQYFNVTDIAARVKSNKSYRQQINLLDNKPYSYLEETYSHLNQQMELVQSVHSIFEVKGQLDRLYNQLNKQNQSIALTINSFRAESRLNCPKTSRARVKIVSLQQQAKLTKFATLKSLRENYPHLDSQYRQPPNSINMNYIRSKIQKPHQQLQVQQQKAVQNNNQAIKRNNIQIQGTDNYQLKIENIQMENSFFSKNHQDSPKNNIHPNIQKQQYSIDNIQIEEKKNNDQSEEWEEQLYPNSKIVNPINKKEEIMPVFEPKNQQQNELVTSQEVHEKNAIENHFERNKLIDKQKDSIIIDVNYKQRYSSSDRNVFKSSPQICYRVPQKKGQDSSQGEQIEQKSLDYMAAQTTRKEYFQLDNILDRGRILTETRFQPQKQTQKTEDSFSGQSDSINYQKILQSVSKDRPFITSTTLGKYNSLLGTKTNFNYSLIYPQNKITQRLIIKPTKTNLYKHSFLNN